MHADETVAEVRKDGRPAGAESRMWLYRSGELESNPVILYEFQKTRKKEHAREFLKDFSGICVTDGYQVYHSIADEREDLTISGCWPHARRGFADVVKAAGKTDLNIRESVAYKNLQLIQTMSRYEEKFAKLEPAERLEARIHHVLPLVDAFFAYLKSKEGRVAPKSATGKAISYCLNQETFLRVFLTDGYVPMTNNAAEQSIDHLQSEETTGSRLIQSEEQKCLLRCDEIAVPENRKSVVRNRKSKVSLLHASLLA